MSDVPRYCGPLAIITTAEAAQILPLLQGRPDLAAVVARLHAAVNAEASWREPVR